MKQSKERIFNCDSCGKNRGFTAMCLECSGISFKELWKLINLNLIKTICKDCCNCK